MIDLIYERGLSRAETIWGDPNECRFPLFDGLFVLPLKGMLAVYTLMFIGINILVNVFNKSEPIIDCRKCGHYIRPLLQIELHYIPVLLLVFVFVGQKSMEQSLVSLRSISFIAFVVKRQLLLVLYLLSSNDCLKTY